MYLFDMFQKRFFLDKLLSTFLASKKGFFMDCLDMSIQMMFITKSHDALSALERFLMGMGD